MLLTAEAERRFICAIFAALDVSPAQQDAIADVLTEADLRGYSSHGIVRVPLNVNLIRSGNVQREAHPTVIHDSGPALRIDGDRAAGPYAATVAAKQAIDRAQKHGVCAVGVSNCGHIGMAGYYVELAARTDLVGLLFAKSETFVHPYGGVEPLIGTNPIAIAIPSDPDPYLLDMSSSAIAAGKLREAQRAGRPLPMGVAVDAEGNPTTDPIAAGRGALSAAGGAKGYGLALATELLGGLLVGGVVGDMKVRDGPRALWGCLIIVVDPACLTDLADFKRRAGAYVESVRGSRKAPGFGEILIPGERSFRTRRARLAGGVPIADDVWATVSEIARGLGIDPAAYVADAQGA
ncbi:MAG TPA: Ldh family oxidoreductase [Chloroflexota bacterium]|nr:Ldh family oxidoreductase [Chloroflexota bacterium]